MGTYTDLCVAGYPLWSSKRDVDPAAMTIFRETDRREFRRKVCERNPLVWGTKEDESEENAITYSCRVATAIDRLNVMGFSLARTRKDFEKVRALELETYAAWALEKTGETPWFAREQEFLRGLNFDDYLAGLRSVVAEGMTRWSIESENLAKLPALAQYILSENDEYEFGFLCSDVRFLIRAACEVVDSNAEVVQDITDLVEGGYFDAGARVCEQAVQSLTEDYPRNSPTVILTEGSTDREFFEAGLRVLFPHLSGYYSFMEFATARPQGGAGALASVVKAFAGAGISNRIVAMFDNDTAAHDACRGLRSIALPPNILVRHYPELEFLRDYPTLGPSGQAIMDVNGLAGSIEMYLGQDVLTLGGVTPLQPVQWRGFNEALARYQGEIMHKERVHAVFRQKVERFLRGDSGGVAPDWTGLHAILTAVFRAFEDHP
jgi:hypothetical protein